MKVIATACSALWIDVSDTKMGVICLYTYCGGKWSFTIIAAGLVHKQTIDFAYKDGALSADRELAVEIPWHL